MAKRGLGKGLESFFDDANPIELDEKSSIIELKLTEIEPNSKQPRKAFDKDKISILADSIREHGVIQPIVVVKNNIGTYKIVAGERRWRAAKLAGLKTIPAVIRDYLPQAVTEVALIENLQREDLNPIEEALGYKSLLDEFELTQEMISKRIGKSRSAIANSLRLLTLNDRIQEALISGEISSGHARAVLSVEDEKLRDALVKRIISDRLNVRQAENLAKQLQKVPKKKNKEKSAYEIELDAITSRLASHLGTKVRISHGEKKGKIEIEYYGNHDLERLLSFFE